ncbi:MAG: hypothetical protein ACI86H_002365 [bacterium]|jgi:hypothetical protein
MINPFQKRVLLQILFSFLLINLFFSHSIFAQKQYKVKRYSVNHGITIKTFDVIRKDKFKEYEFCNYLSIIKQKRLLHSAKLCGEGMGIFKVVKGKKATVVYHSIHSMGESGGSQDGHQVWYVQKNKVTHFSIRLLKEQGRIEIKDLDRDGFPEIIQQNIHFSSRQIQELEEPHLIYAAHVPTIFRFSNGKLQNKTFQYKKWIQAWVKNIEKKIQAKKITSPAKLASYFHIATQVKKKKTVYQFLQKHIPTTENDEGETFAVVKTFKKSESILTKKVNAKVIRGKRIYSFSAKALEQWGFRWILIRDYDSAMASFYSASLQKRSFPNRIRQIRNLLQKQHRQLRSPNYKRNWKKVQKVILKKYSLGMSKNLKMSFKKSI